MSTPGQEVFGRCLEVAKQLEASGRVEDSVAVLKALVVYLDVSPAFPGRSCYDIVVGRLERLGRHKEASG